MKKRKIAFPEDVRISRDGIYAHVDFIDPSYVSRRIEIGPKLSSMSDAEILRLHNDIVFSEQKKPVAAQWRPIHLVGSFGVIGCSVYVSQPLWI